MKWSKKGLIYNSFHSQLPIIQKHGDCYKCYLTPRNENNQSYIRQINFKLNPLVVEDCGCVLEPSHHFDCDGTMTSCVVQSNQQEYLYYTGWRKLDSPFYQHNICLAIDFEKLTEPVIKSNASDFGICSSPFIMIESKWRMWFISGNNGDGWVENRGVLSPTYTIHYAESNDGIEWIRSKVNFHREHREIFSRPFVFKEDGIYKMLYSKMIMDDKKRYDIGYAESKDGISWKRLDAEAGIKPSGEGWDSDSVAFPWIIDNYLFYAGNDFGKGGFGYAERI